MLSLASLCAMEGGTPARANPVTNEGRVPWKVAALSAVTTGRLDASMSVFGTRLPVLGFIGKRGAPGTEG